MTDRYTKMTREQRDEYSHMRSDVGTIGRGAIMSGIGLVVFAGFGLWLASILLAPTKVFDPQNIKANYEWFHDVNRDFGARVNQIAAHRTLLKSTDTDAAERNRLRIETAGMQAACRELAARYNSRATQIHRGIFQGTSVPSTLDASKCE
jgi:hypothetical protein